MNIKLFIGKSDLDLLWDANVKHTKKPHLNQSQWEKAIIKAEASHLLNILTQPCKHGLRLQSVDMAYGCKVTIAYNRLIDCPECMREVSAILPKHYIGTITDITINGHRDNVKEGEK